jgi:hypothetical protein
VSRNEQLAEIPAGEISQAVARVVASEGFANSRRLRRFLTYVAEKSLAGRPDELKEYSIALAVFDRPPTFDSRTDTIVRVEARRLRQQLAAYYQGAGQNDPVVIEIPRGGYGPVFRSQRRRGQIWRWAAGSLFAIALVFWAAGAFPRHLEPDTWDLEGSTLKVLSVQGGVCWQKEFPRFDQEYDQQVVDKVLVADIDGDGRKEVLVSFVPEKAHEGGSILCFEASGKLRWEHHLGVPKTFGSRTFEPAYRGRFLRRVLIAGRPYVLTVANHYIWYPSQVALLDPRTGRVVDEYWHPGAIYHCLLRDPGADGEPELLLGAVNNPGTGLGHAALAVLKLPILKVAHYALFPLPDVAKVMGQLPVITKMSIDSRHRIMVQTPLPESGGIVYYLDAQLQVIECRFSDNFPFLHDRFFHQRLLDHRMTSVESEHLRTIAYFIAAPDGNDPQLEKWWSGL